MQVKERGAGNDERGAVAIIIAILSVVIFGFTAFAVDLGNSWQSRRHIITGTDAGALAAAQEYALGGNGCSIAPDFVTDNDPNATNIDCTPGGGAIVNTPPGFVTVGAETPVDYTFAGVIGIADDVVASETTAKYEVAQTVRGLRPFGLCSSAAAWLMTQPAGSTHKIYYLKESQATENPLLECPENPSGNWAMIDLDDHHPVGANDLKDWTRNGYDGSVAPGPIGGDTGALANFLGSALADSVGDTFCLPVYDGVAPSGGSNAEFNVTGFAAVKLISFNVTGTPEQRYLEIEYLSPALCEPGDDGNFSAIDFGTLTIRICDVDDHYGVVNCLTP